DDVGTGPMPSRTVNHSTDATMDTRSTNTATSVMLVPRAVRSLTLHQPMKIHAQLIAADVRREMHENQPMTPAGKLSRKKPRSPTPSKAAPTKRATKKSTKASAKTPRAQETPSRRAVAFVATVGVGHGDTRYVFVPFHPNEQWPGLEAMKIPRPQD